MNIPSVTVIMYHYVRDLKDSLYPEIKGLDYRSFIKQLNYIRKNYNVVRIEEIIETLEIGKPIKENGVLLTFDDGYIDHYDYVFPVLKKFGYQGSFYLPAKSIKENKVLDVNKIHFILASVSNKKRILNYIKYFIESNINEYNLQTYSYYFQKFAIANRFDTAVVSFI